MNRKQIADLVLHKLESGADRLLSQWEASGPVHHCIVDDLLPAEVALKIRAAYPPAGSMRTRRSLRELKFVAAQMDQYDPILEEALYAFQDPRIVEIVGKITGLRNLEPDELLYAGGISMMSSGHYLNPHLDNSHDKSRERYRALNLLYYVSPDWKRSNGGNLELWPEGPDGEQIVVDATFNRLTIMITNQESWHSVSPITVDGLRCCVSNYYFSRHPAAAGDYFHVTKFRGRPEQPVRDIVLRLDSMLRMALRKLFPKGAVQTKHFYNRNDKSHK
jgi:Rps23 Pro-64 3,4-dihydroxylase Tpa1-like proline 4-hydroxylase